MINVVLVSGAQQGDSVVHTHASFLFQILFPIRLLQNTEQSSLCYTESSYWFLQLRGVVEKNCFIPDSRDIWSKTKLEKNLSKNPN